LLVKFKTEFIVLSNWIIELSFSGEIEPIFYIVNIASKLNNVATIVGIGGSAFIITGHIAESKLAKQKFISRPIARCSALILLSNIIYCSPNEVPTANIYIKNRHFIVNSLISGIYRQTVVRMTIPIEI